MSTSLAKIVITIVTVHVWLAFASAAAITIPDIGECTGFLDVFTGCSGLIGAVSSLVLGTVVGAPLLVNALFLALQGIWLALNIAEFLRGRAV